MRKLPNFQWKEGFEQSLALCETRLMMMCAHLDCAFSVPEKPRITHIANRTDTMLQFEWEHPVPNGRLQGYKVCNVMTSMTPKILQLNLKLIQALSC